MEEPVVKPAVYVWTWVALMLLLAATAAAYGLPLGPWNLVISMTIAVLKALLVVLFFMHVRYHPRLVWIWSGVGFYWLGIMLSLTLSDYLTRGWLPIGGK